ncbi:hypothetical protein P0W64_00780 [Tsukamurella sp. 8F]|uniref:hypothetical protein n=1 Tax=unclassified Tsukamurella TaxID=2633480 RepID=UPI0023B8E4E2|nr:MULTISPECIES: hypothetical protein [unclassified Tsukamurella]MDF0531390.1 hypothetical protein [Tsukamurella sp. 8J]MDF0585304.1 hypothetical protein [Tsukamurella sp. 8F]
MNDGQPYQAPQNQGQPYPNQYPGQPIPRQPYPGQSYQAPYAGQSYQQPSQGYPNGGYPNQQYGGQYPGQQPGGRPGPVFQARFKKHTGMIIIAQWQTRTVVGSYDDVRRAYREAQTHCLVAGWWGFISLLIYNWIAIFGNMSEMSRIAKQARAAGLQV